MTRPAFLDNLKSQRHLFRQAIKDGKFAVYAYLRETDGTPYYIGFHGSKNRAYCKQHCVGLPREELIRLMGVFSSRKLAGKFEARLIARYGKKSANNGILLNLADGGEKAATGSVKSDATRAKLSKSLKGRTFSKKHIANMCKARKGIKFSAEHCKNLSIANKGVPHSMSAKGSAVIVQMNKNRVWTDEQRAKVANARLGTKATAKTKAKMSESKVGRTLEDQHVEAIVHARYLKSAQRYNCSVEFWIALPEKSRKAINKRYARGKRGAELLQGIAA